MSAQAQQLDIARTILEKALDLPVRVRRADAGTDAVDAEWTLGDARFLVEVKSNARSTSVARAIEQLQTYRSRHTGPVGLLLVVPHMTEAAAELCKRARVNWVDLDGNASIHELNLRVWIQGLRKHVAHGFDEPGRLNPFSHKASRVGQVLLTDPKRLWGRSELQASSRLDKGFVSKVLGELLKQGYLMEEAGPGRIRNVRVRDPLVLLDAWSEQYRPRQPYAWGLLAASDGFDAASKVSDILKANNIEYALTGLPAAAEYSKFGSFRRVDAYVPDTLAESVLKELRVGPDSRGRNVCLIIDELAATIGVQHIGNRRYASPPLVYLDLANLPERSDEARDEMRRYLEELWK